MEIPVRGNALTHFVPHALALAPRAPWQRNTAVVVEEERVERNSGVAGAESRDRFHRQPWPKESARVIRQAPKARWPKTRQPYKPRYVR